MSVPPAGEQSGAHARWQVCRDFRIKEWQDGAVLYDAASGDTHHLSPAAFQIISQLLLAPRTREALARCVLSFDEMAVGDESLAMIDATLAHLVELGLIESINP